MEKLDLKDRKILYQLDLNCRQSNTQIGKKVGLSREVVDYRIKRMEEQGIITGYWTDIDSFKLGYDVYRIYITFQNADQNKKNEIIKYFSDYKNIYSLSGIQGPIDLNCVIWVKNVFEFYKFWLKTQNLYDEYFEKAVTSIYVQTIECAKTFLLPENKDIDLGELYKITCEGKAVKIDKIDYNLLKELSRNARILLIELADKLGCSSQNVKYRIDNLKKKGLIKAFRLNIDESKLNIRYYKLDITLKNHKQRNSIINYMMKKPYFVTLNEAIGWADIEPEIYTKNVDTLIEIMEDLDSKFPGSIKKHSYWVHLKIRALNTLPQMEFNK
jgi:Lrp/AsnC family leucine-responsive transcriptional regulator